MSNIETNNLIVQLLTDAKIQYSIASAGVGLKRDNWECDGWIVEFTVNNTSVQFNYYTGIGHRKCSKFDKSWIEREYKNSRMHSHYIAKYAKPIIPLLSDIMYSLVLDSSSIDESFLDWCDNFGYDNDSISAQNTYNQCCDTAKKLRKVFGNSMLVTINEMLQDY